jgi:ribokinase
MYASPLFILGSFVAAASAKVQRLPVPGESLQASHFIMEAGGKGFNLAVGAARLGGAVNGIFAVGDDFVSGLAEPAFRLAGLSTEMLVRYPGPTGAGIGFIDAQGENCLAVFPGANARLSAEDITAAAARLRRAGLVLAQFEIADTPIITAFNLARDAGATTILNPSPYRPIHPEILRNSSILVVNRIEALRLGADLGLQLSGADPAALAQLGVRLFGHGPEILIVTLGASGVAAFQQNAAPLQLPGFAVSAVDSLGAGDAFTAAFTVALSQHLPLQECLRWGAAAGACVASRSGVFEALPSRAELEAMLTAQRHEAQHSVALLPPTHASAAAKRPSPD